MGNPIEALSAVVEHCRNQIGCSMDNCKLWSICSRYFNEAPARWKVLDGISMKEEPKNETTN